MLLWRHILRSNFTNWNTLADFLELNTHQRSSIDKKARFALNIPLRLAQKCKKGTLNDPILLQFLPDIREKEDKLDFVEDPTSDASFCLTPKLMQKYSGRVLLVCTSACAMHCRYCFRQNFEYNVQNKIFEKEIDAISQDNTLREVILSGGDPLSLSDDLLKDLLARLESIPHIRRIRFHTRFPIGIPERIDESFLTLIRSIKKQIWFVIHTNHANELDAEILSAMEKLRRLGVVIASQTVLLRGVNDHVDTLAQLFFTLVDNGIIPYYLHQLDRVKGTAHFEVPVDKGVSLIKSLTEILPGYAVPKYVREIPGELHKTLII